MEQPGIKIANHLNQFYLLLFYMIFIILYDTNFHVFYFTFSLFFVPCFRFLSFFIDVHTRTHTYISSFNTQSKCSIFRDVILCLCLNLTYANVVRFPRELDRHGVAFLIPYLLLFLLVGMPIILLEIALGQFLGQGSAHSWRASPIFRGKFITYKNVCTSY